MYASANDFGHRVAELLNVETPDEVNPYDSLYEDWGLDSLQAFELIIIVESLAGSLVPPASVPEIFTVQDAFDYYRSMLADSSSV